MAVRDAILGLLAFGAIAIAARSFQQSFSGLNPGLNDFDDFGEFGLAVDFGGAPDPGFNPGSGSGAGFGDLFDQFRGLFGGAEAPPPETTLAPFQGFEPNPVHSIR